MSAIASTAVYRKKQSHINTNIHIYIHIYIQRVLGAKVSTSGYNPRADSESKASYTQGQIGKGSGVRSFLKCRE
jgi:hypothetical protein